MILTRVVLIWSNALKTLFTKLTLARVLIIKRVSCLNVISRLKGFKGGYFLVTTSFSRYSIIIKSNLIITLELNGNRPVFS